MADLIDVFSAHSPKVMPNGQLRMQCPFRENHEGKVGSVTGDGSNSFYATPEINAYHCFSCRAKGRLTTLLTTKFDVSYFDAVEMVNLVPYTKERKEWEMDFSYTITPPKEFLSRKFRADTLNKFKVGYTAKKEIAIPLFMENVLKGIKFRVEGDKRSFWYTHSFVKQEYLYNYDLNRSLKAGYTILVEGETDAWRVDSYGYDVTGLLGVALSDFQKELLMKIPKIYLALDADVAGISAMHKIYNLLHLHTDVEFINFPGKDPEQCSYRQFTASFKHPYNYAEFNYLTTDYE